MNRIILPPERRVIVPPIELKYRVRGMFRLKVRRADGSLRKDTGWFPNLITNQGLDFLFTNTGYLGSCFVGTGNTTPAFTDTQLVAQVGGPGGGTGGQSPNNGNSGTPPYFGFLNMSYAFAQGAAAGNLQEIGIGNGSTQLFSRALILNSSGVPTTLTILSNEFLDVGYQLQLFVPTSDVTGSVTVSGTVCNYTMRAANAAGLQWGNGLFGNYPDGMGNARPFIFNDTSLQPITGALVGAAQGSPSTSVNGSYTTGQFFVDTTSTYDFTQCNGGANNSAMLAFGRVGSMGSAQIIFGATIPKTSSQVMTLTFRQSWARM
jgi:hypothetical protein